MAISAPWEGSITALKGMHSGKRSYQEGNALHHHDYPSDSCAFVGKEACWPNEHTSIVHSNLQTCTGCAATDTACDKKHVHISQSKEAVQTSCATRLFFVQSVASVACTGINIAKLFISE